MQFGARMLRRPGDSVLLSGIRWRLGASVLTVVISAIAVAAAVLGPLYLRAAGDSVVRDAVQQASPESLGVTLLAPSGEVVSAARMTAAEQAVERAGGGRWYGEALTTVQSGVSLHAPDGSPLSSALLFRSGICSVLSFRQGSCGGAPGEVVVSDRSAAELGVSVGSVMDAGVRGETGQLALKVAGVYAVPDLTLGYWWGEGPGYFPFGVPTGPGRTPQVARLSPRRRRPIRCRSRRYPR